MKSNKSFNLGSEVFTNILVEEPFKRMSAMADFNFVVDCTMPGLCASDLTRRSGRAAEASYSNTVPAARKSRWSKISDLRILKDLGLDRSSC